MTADMWSVRADFEQAIIDKAIDQWRKRLWACMKAKGEHAECLLWLAVATVCCLYALFQAT